MGKGNLFLGLGRGSVGDITYYRQHGEQVFRARNRHPANPQTDFQLFQRVVMLTAQRGYSMLQPLCDHSFQGREYGTMNQARFTALNVNKLRADFAWVLESMASGYDDWYSAANFAGKFSVLPQYTDYIISEGTLNPLTVDWVGGMAIIKPVTLDSFVDLGSMTYSEFLTVMGLQRGDQLTFIQLFIDDRDETHEFNAIKFARVILEPDDGKISDEMFDESGSGSMLQVISPNPLNEGSVYFSSAEYATGKNGLRFTFADAAAAEVNGAELSPAAAAVIVSRRAGNTWLRSSQNLVLRNYTTGTGNLTSDHGTGYLADAMDTLRVVGSSSRYLNQAE